MSQQAPPFRVWWDGTAEIVQVEWADGALVDLPAARAATTAVRELGRDRVRMLVDSRGVKVFGRDARAHFLADQADSIAMALIAGSAVNKMIANFFIGMHRQPMPMRMFTDHDAAIAWLHEQR